jgi:hypothetical protein
MILGLPANAIPRSATTKPHLFFGRLRPAFGLHFDAVGLIQIDSRRGAQANAANPINKK